MNKFNAKKIIVKYLANEATTLEQEQLRMWVKSEKNQKIFKEFAKAQQLINIAYNTIDPRIEFEDFLKLIQSQENKTKSKFKTFVPYLKYAAAIIGVLFAYQYFVKKQDITVTTVDLKNKLSLQILNEGNEYYNIDIDKTISTKNGAPLAIVENGVLKYASNFSNTINSNDQHLLTVPYGKTFKVILSDGTSIQLNAGSTLKYPSVFKKNIPREVFIEGEGYFSVSNISNTPFIVNSKTISTKVLGTEFNISSYLDNDKTEIVLIEGSVGVKLKSTSKEPNKYTLILPSEKASVTHNTQDLEITSVNVEKYIAWKEGSLIFQNDKFETIKKILERHYNVKIINHFADIEKFKYNGNFKNDSVEKILNTIKLHTNFTFERIGDKITINKPIKNK